MSRFRLRLASVASAQRLSDALDEALGYPIAWRDPAGNPVPGQTDHHLAPPVADGREGLLVGLTAAEAEQCTALAAVIGLRRCDVEEEEGAP
jgi:hypothetical protein